MMVLDRSNRCLILALTARTKMSCDISTPGLAEFVAAHSSLLARLHEQTGADRWGVSLEEFATATYRSTVHRFDGSLPAADLVESYLCSVHVEDLALACALRRGSKPAWEEFVSRYRPILYSAARAIVGAAGEEHGRELADSLYAELYGLESAQRARSRALLDYFHGRSKLSTWLRTILAQRHVDTLRASQRTESIEDREDPGRAFRITVQIPDGGSVADPDRARLLPQLQRAVAAALATLEPAERLLLALYYVQEMTLAQIARLRDVHEATGLASSTEFVEACERRLKVSLPERIRRWRARRLSPAEIELCFPMRWKTGLLTWAVLFRTACATEARP